MEVPDSTSEVSSLKHGLHLSKELLLAHTDRDVARSEQRRVGILLEKYLGCRTLVGTDRILKDVSATDLKPPQDPISRQAAQSESQPFPLYAAGVLSGVTTVESTDRLRRRRTDITIPEVCVAVITQPSSERVEGKELYDLIPIANMRDLQVEAQDGSIVHVDLG